MKFRFCGDFDCPDWLLAQIAVISKLTSIKLKLLTQHVAKTLIEDELMFDKVTKLTSDANLSVKEAKACVTALSFILETSTKNLCNSVDLNNELQQLGLPSENAQSIAKVYADQFNNLKEHLATKMMKFHPLVVNSVSVANTSGTNGEQVQFAELQAVVGNEKMTILVTENKLKTLVSELKVAKQKLDAVSD